MIMKYHLSAYDLKDGDKTDAINIPKIENIL